MLKKQCFYGFFACTSNSLLNLGQQMLTPKSTNVAFLESSSHSRQIFFLFRLNIPKTHESKLLRNWKSSFWKNEFEIIDFTLFSLLFLGLNSIQNSLFWSNFFSTLIHEFLSKSFHSRCIWHPNWLIFSNFPTTARHDTYTRA